jgi:uncharacterized protein YbjT (DUF2867 family)
MKIVVLGGTGLIGAKIVARLTQQGHEAVAASRTTGVDLLTGTGLAAVLEGAGAAVDVSNSGYGDAEDMQRFFEASGPHLVTAARAAGIGNLVTLSAVGTGRLDSGYFRAKAAQEDLVVESDLPFTIVRSTPFFEYIYNIIDSCADGGFVRLPPVRMQPVAADDVASALARVATSPAGNGILEVAGPDTWQLPMLAQAILTANEDARTVIVDPDAPYFGAHIGDEPLVGGPHPRFAPTGFEDWLRRLMIPA